MISSGHNFAHDMADHIIGHFLFYVNIGLGAWRHQAITWTMLTLHQLESCGIYMRKIAWIMQKTNKKKQPEMYLEEIDLK